MQESWRKFDAFSVKLVYLRNFGQKLTIFQLQDPRSVFFLNIAKSSFVAIIVELPKYYILPPRN